MTALNVGVAGDQGLKRFVSHAARVAVGAAALTSEPGTGKPLIACAFASPEAVIVMPAAWSAGMTRSTLPEGVQIFLAARGLDGAFAEAVELARQSFPPGSGFSFRVEEDPDSDGAWAVIDVSAEGTVDEVLGCYSEFVRRWTRSAPPWVGNHVRVTFNLS